LPSSPVYFSLRFGNFQFASSVAEAIQGFSIKISVASRSSLDVDRQTPD